MLKIEFSRYDTEVTVTLPKDPQGYFTSKYKTQEIEQITSNLQRIRIGLLKKLLTQDIAIKKEKTIVFFVLESKGKIAIKNEKETKKGTTATKISKKRQRESIVNRYDFAYLGRDTIN